MLAVTNLKRWILLVLILLLVLSAGYYRYQFPVYHVDHKTHSIHEGLSVHNERTSTSSDTSQLVLEHRTVLHTDPAPTLPQTVIDKVQTFVLFVGYPRSGHSILGSMMDAHPHMIIAHELFLLDEWWTAQEQTGHDITKQLVFRAIYNNSRANAARGWRNSLANTKGYSLKMQSPWMGRYDGSLRVMGDKSGGNTAYVYMKSANQFVDRYSQLKAMVGVPIRVIHVVRNPYDIISTTTLYEVGKVRFPGLGRGAKKVSNFVHEVKSRFMKVKNETSDIEQLDRARLTDRAQLNQQITSFLKMVKAVRDIIEYIGAENVLEVHNYQLVADPAKVMRQVCDFLGVHCSEDYLAACVEKTFKELSLSRQYVAWWEEERERVGEMMADYVWFYNYSFNSDI